MKIGFLLVMLIFMNTLSGYTQIKQTDDETDTLEFDNTGSINNGAIIGRVIVNHDNKRKLSLSEREQTKDSSGTYRTVFYLDPGILPDPFHLDSTNISDIKINLKFNKPVMDVSYVLTGKANGVASQISKDHQSYELSIKKLITYDVTITVISKPPVFTTITGISGFAKFLPPHADGQRQFPH